MGGPASIAAALVCAAFVGVSIQRGGTCLVGAVDDLVHRGDRRKLMALVVAPATLAGGYAVVHAATGSALVTTKLAVTPQLLVGGFLLGMGACINGACTMGSIARFGSGNWSFVAMPIGLILGCWMATTVLPGSVLPVRSEQAPDQINALAPVLAPVALVIGAWLIVRHRRWRPPADWRQQMLRHPWSPAFCALAVGVLWIALTALVGSWSYTDLAFSLGTAHTTRVVLLGALATLVFAAAVLAGRFDGRWAPTPVRPLTLLRSLGGGFVMGFGVRLLTGGNDSLTFVGLPLLLPHAAVAMSCALVTIMMVVWTTRHSSIVVAASRSEATHQRSVHAHADPSDRFGTN
jgi:toxin CptA